MNEFKLIVAGGRDFNDEQLLIIELMNLVDNELTNETVSIVSGMAKGADWLAYKFCMENQVKCYEFPADWDKYGKSAGFKRNDEMAKFSDGLLAFWDGESRGTKHMVYTMQSLGKPVWIVNY